MLAGGKTCCNNMVTGYRFRNGFKPEAANNTASCQVGHALLQGDCSCRAIAA